MSGKDLNNVVENGGEGGLEVNKVVNIHHKTKCLCSVFLVFSFERLHYTSFSCLGYRLFSLVSVTDYYHLCLI